MRHAGEGAARSPPLEGIPRILSGERTLDRAQAERVPRARVIKGHMSPRTWLRNPLVLAAAATAVLTAALWLAWRETPLGEMITTQGAIEWVLSLSSRWWTPIVLILLFVPAGITMFPRQLITIAAVIAYGPWKGFLISMAGCELASLMGYYPGLLLRPETVERLAGRRMGRIKRALRTQGLAAVSTMRLLPLGPFIVGSLVAGALRIRVWELVAGTFIGMAPGLAVTTLVGDQIAAGFAGDRQVNRWLLTATALAFVALMALSRIWMKRLTEEA
jgi:phospholipase D1/2